MAAGPARSRLLVAVRVKPGASRAVVGGRYDGPGGPALVVAVGTRAVDGMATEAVQRAVAVALGVRRRQVILIRGRTSRDKVLAVDDAPAEAASRVAELRGDVPDPGGDLVA